MIGEVDHNEHALIYVEIHARLRAPARSISAWIDTAFDGHFVFSAKLIDELGLELLAETEAILADGTKVVLETFLAYLEWFEEIIPVQVVSNNGVYPLLGTGLLSGRRLTIDYGMKSVEIV